MGSVGPGELLLIALIALLLFGAGRMASIGKGLGQGIRNFKEGLREIGEPTEEKTASARVEKEAYRGRERPVSRAPPPSEPDGRFSRIRLSSQWALCRD
jgi:sec-independent protein translocase protein TatA